MLKITGTKIELTKGDTLQAQVTILQKDKPGDEPTPYTPKEGDIVRFAMKKNYYDGAPLILKTIPNDSMILVLNPDDTAPLPFGDYVYDIEITFAGQDVGSNNGNGASVIVGQAVCSYSGNANNIVGASIYNQGNGNTIVGRQHISRKNRWFMAGTGHDNTNGKSESGCAIGEWSLISSDTAFCIGNGTNQTNRSNLFEIKTNGDVYINGVKVLP